MDSAVPGGTLLHRAVAKAVTRQTQGVLQQAADFASAARDAIEALRQGLEHHGHADLEADVAAVHERLAAVDRAASGLSIGMLLERIEALEELERRRGFRPRFATLELRDHLQRDPQAAAARQARLDRAVAELGDAARVVDLGCGRGDLMVMLAERGVEAVGVDGDPVAVAEARSRALEVEEGDLVTWMRSQPSLSIGAATLVDVVEELETQELLDVVDAVATALVPGGVFVVVASMPSAGGARPPRRSVPTWRRAVHPDYLSFVVDRAGLRDARVDAFDGDGDFVLTARK